MIPDCSQLSQHMLVFQATAEQEECKPGKRTRNLPALAWKKPWFSYPNNLGCHREKFLCSEGKGWFLISSEAKCYPSITNCLLRTVVREVERLLQILSMQTNQRCLPWVTKDFLRVYAKLGVGGPISSFDKISTLVCFACVTCLTILFQKGIRYGPSPQALALSTDTAAYLICRKAQFYKLCITWQTTSQEGAGHSAQFCFVL